MSDNENNNKDLKPGGESSPPTDQVSQTDAPAVDSETTDTSSAEEENQQAHKGSYRNAAAAVTW